jgi:hypothetical protein
VDFAEIVVSGATGADLAEEAIHGFRSAVLHVRQELDEDACQALPPITLRR